MFSYGGLMVLAPETTTLNVLLQLNFLSIAAGRLHEMMWTWSTGLVSGSPRRKFQSFIFKAPYTIISFALALLPTRLRGFATSDINIEANGKIVARQGFWKRFGWFLLDPHTGVVVSFCGSIGVSLWRAFRDYNGGMNLNQSIRTSFHSLSLLPDSDVRRDSDCAAHYRLAVDDLDRHFSRVLYSFVRPWVIIQERQANNI